MKAEHDVGIDDCPSMGERLRHIRRAAKLTQAELATLLDTHQGYISDVERGAKPPGRILLERWVEVCPEAVVRAKRRPSEPIGPFGTLLHQQRTRAGLTTKGLRRRLVEVVRSAPSETLLSYWHRGERMPRLDHIVALSRALGWSPSERLAAYDAHAEQWDGPARQVLTLARRFGWTDLARLDAYDIAAHAENQ